MLLKSHRVINFAAYTSLAIHFNTPVTILGLVMVSLGSSLPDIDNPSSKMGHRFPFIAKRLKHRWITHSVYMIALCAIILKYTHISLLTALIIGIIGHIIVDLFSTDGVYFFSSNDQLVMPLTYKVDGKFERFIRKLAWILFLYNLLRIVIPVLNLGYWLAFL